jgi:hypothetical protein
VALPLDNENWDPNGYHDNVTNNTRITPTVAGKYRVLGQVEWSSNATGQRNISIRANGTTFHGIRNQNPVSDAGASTFQEVNAVLDMNGTTDYVELMVATGVGAAANVVGTSAFQGGVTLQRIAV